MMPFQFTIILLPQNQSIVCSFRHQVSSLLITGMNTLKTIYMLSLHHFHVISYFRIH